MQHSRGGDAQGAVMRCCERVHEKNRRRLVRDISDNAGITLQANDCVRRVSELQKEVLHCKQELHACRLAAQHTANHVAHVQVASCMYGMQLLSSLV